MTALVHPGDVEALKVRLGPAVFAATATLRTPEADALARQWGDYCATRATWATAPAELEHGRDLEARLTKINSGDDDELIASGAVTGAKSMADVDLGRCVLQREEVEPSRGGGQLPWGQRDPEDETTGDS